MMAILRIVWVTFAGVPYIGLGRAGRRFQAMFGSMRGALMRGAEWRMRTVRQYLV
jgi:hypothetical protein